MNSIKTYLPILLFTITCNVYSQYTEVINSNRPGVSKSAFAVGPSVIQFEVGPYIIKEEHTPLKYEVSGFGVDFTARYGLLFEELELNIEGIYQNDTFKDNRSAISTALREAEEEIGLDFSQVSPLGFLDRLDTI